MLLDSGNGAHNDGRFDIIVARPIATLSYRNQQIELHSANDPAISGAIDIGNKKPSQVMRELLEVTSPGNHQLPADYNYLPFHGGALGYFGYDLGRMIELLPTIAEHDLDIADMAVGIYHWAYITDHQQQRSLLVNFGMDSEAWRELQSEFHEVMLAKPSATDFSLESSWQSNLDESEYLKAFAKVSHYIQAGDCYQVNLAQRFTASYQGNPWRAYQALALDNHAPFSGYLNFGDWQVLSTSPERFIECRDRKIKTQPIKGTRPRSSDPEQDKLLAAKLLASEKDQAENLMIVDLLRNDIGRSAAIGSVRVTNLFELQSFQSVHHLVSTIEAELDRRFDAIDLLVGCFPGGSITGAPKVRAMEVIEELEPHRRNVYCGAIGFVDYRDHLDTNIAIRSLVTKAGKIYCWAGGGLVADSEAQEEYQETFDKLGKIIPILERFT